MINCIRSGILLLLVIMPLHGENKPADWQPSQKTLTALQKAGEAAELPIGLAECLAYQESRFVPWITGRGGKDRGLMQINSDYELYLADKFFPGGHKAFRWWIASDSATLGCSYLAYLIEYFRGSLYLALIAYNFGPNNLKEIRSLDDIPKKSIEYADNILKHLDLYY